MSADAVIVMANADQVFDETVQVLSGFAADTLGVIATSGMNRNKGQNKGQVGVGLSIGLSVGLSIGLSIGLSRSLSLRLKGLIL